jgi:type IV pilus assembly protein PilC
VYSPNSGINAHLEPLRGRVRQSDVTTFLRQFIMLLEAGTPILKALKTLSERGERASVRRLVADLAQYVENGNGLWQAFERHPQIFDTVFVSLIKASEASGTLVDVMRGIVVYREKSALLQKRILGGMLYPVILMVACFGVVLFITKVVVPEFEEMFSKFDVAMPAFTVYFMSVSRFIDKTWWLFGLLAIGLVCGYKFWYVRNAVRRITADRLKFRLPIVGPILRKHAVVEFTRTLSLLLRSGLSMMATLELTRNAIHNRAFAHVLQGVRDSVERGEGLEGPLREAGDIVPSVVTDMMVTGEETGRLDSIAEQVAYTYEEEVHIAVSTLGETLQPVLTIFLGVVVVLLMLAVFVPLLSMLDQLGSQGA